MTEDNFNTVKKMDDVLSKIKRSETALNHIIEKLSETQKLLSEDSGRLTLEVIEIANTTTVISNLVSQSIESKMDAIIPKITQIMVKDVENKLKDSNTINMEKIKIAGGTAHEVILKANDVMTSFKKELTVRRLWLGAMFFMGSLITAGGIYYFFPQNIHYNADEEFIKTYRVGKVVREIFNDLSPEVRKTIQKKYEIYKD